VSVKITVIGTGYVGLVSGACFAELGHDVICVDKDTSKLDSIANGIMPIYEPGLEELVKKNISNGRLRFSNDTPLSVKGREAVFIAVGTPADPDTGRANLSYVFSAAREVAEAVDTPCVIIVKSTVPVGTNREVGRLSRQYARQPALTSIASNPEFLREGAAINDFMHPDRIVAGCEDEHAASTMRKIYAPLVAADVKLVITSVETAEMIKYASNAFLAVKVSFINEISNLCEALGADIQHVSLGIGLDTRIGAAFLKPGPGWGGSCFPKDTSALINMAQDNSIAMSIVSSAVQSNSNRKSEMVQRIYKACNYELNGKTLGVLGLTFKGQTDDMRDSPAIDILNMLISEHDCQVNAFDPSHPVDADSLVPKISIKETAELAAKDADLLIVLTDWAVFTSYDLKQLSAAMKRPVLLDLRNLFNAASAIEAGFEDYFCLGRGPN
jgi:UDPglucose 6-dehydrogenase